MLADGAASIEVSFWPAVATGLATVVLVYVTWGYAHSTAQIASATAEAAEWARRTAESSLVQGALMVQPRMLQVAPLKVESVSSGILGLPQELGRIPVKVSTTLRNDGPGPALNAHVKVTMWGVELAEKTPPDGLSIPPGDSIDIQHDVETEHRPQLARAIEAGAPQPQIGRLEITCEDSLGYTVFTSWAIVKRADAPTELADRRVEYSAPSSERRDVPNLPLPSRRS